MPIWRRPNLAPLFAIAVCAELGYAVLNVSAMGPYLREVVQVKEGVIALIITVFLLSEAAFKSPMGHLGDHNGRRFLLIFAPLISVATALLTTAVHYEFAFVVLRIMDGVGAAMIWPNIFAAAGHAVTRSERTEAIGVLNMCYWVGIALGPFLDGLVFKTTQLFIEGGDRRASFYLVAVLFAAASYLAWRFVPDDRAKEDENGEEKPALQLSKIWHAAREIPGHVLMSVVTFVGVGFPIAIIKFYAKDILKVDDLQFGSMLLPAAIVMALLSMPMSRAVERFGRPNAVKIGLVLGATGMWALAFTTNLFVLGLVGCIVGLGFLIAIPAWLAVVSDVDESRRGTFLGVIQTAQGVGAMIGTPVGGFLYQKVAHNAPFVGTACALTVALGISLWLFSRQPPKGEDPPILPTGPGPMEGASETVGAGGFDVAGAGTAVGEGMETGN